MEVSITKFKSMSGSGIVANLDVTVTSRGKAIFKAVPVVQQASEQPADTTKFAKPMWLGEWSGDVWGTVRRETDRANAAGEVPVFILYNIPGRDNGNYSAGGLHSPEEYYAWVGAIADAIGTSISVCVLEPDALGLSRTLNTEQKEQRYAMLKGATAALKAKPNVKVFVDASMWVPVEENKVLVGRITGVDGFSVNVSGYEHLEKCLAYGSELANGTTLQYIVDTSRNGNGNPHPPMWCNVTDTKVGTPARLINQGAVYAYMWLKVPGESDGLGINDDGSNPRSDVPSAGTMWPEYRDAIYSGDWSAFKAKYGV